MKKLIVKINDKKVKINLSNIKGIFYLVNNETKPYNEVIILYNDESETNFEFDGWRKANELFKKLNEETPGLFIDDSIMFLRNTPRDYLNRY